MSIINEALKKAINEKEKTVSSALKANIEKSLGPELLRQKKSFNWGPVFVLAVLLLIVGPIAAPVISAPFLSRSNSLADGRLELAGVPVSSASSVSSSTQKGQFAVEESPIFGDKSHGSSGMPTFIHTPNLQLSGVVCAPEGSYCIINGKVLKAGESIHGAQIKQIDSNRVELDFKGETVSLYLSR